MSPTSRLRTLIGMGSVLREVLSQRLLDAPLPSGVGRRMRAGERSDLPLTFMTCYRRARDKRRPARCAARTTSPGPASAPRGIQDTHQSGGVAWTPRRSRPLEGWSHEAATGPARGPADTGGA